VHEQPQSGWMRPEVTCTIRGKQKCSVISARTAAGKVALWEVGSSVGSCRRLRGNRRLQPATFPGWLQDPISDSASLG
jgi:hypothetical protein